MKKNTSCRSNLSKCMYAHSHVSVERYILLRILRIPVHCFQGFGAEKRGKDKRLSRSTLFAY